MCFTCVSCGKGSIYDCIPLLIMFMRMFCRTVCLLFPSFSDSPSLPRSRSISFSLSVSLPLLPLPPPFPHMLLLQVNFLLFLSLRSEKTDTLALLIPIKADFLLTG